MHIIIQFTANLDFKELAETVTFDSSHNSTIISVTINKTTESNPEEDEEFTVNLAYPDEPILRVKLEPNITTVKIIEFDGVSKYTHSRDKHEALHFL